MKRTLFSILTVTLIAVTMYAEQWIRVNQLGYLPQSVKVAVWMSNEATVVSQFQLIDAFTGKVAYTGTKIRKTSPLQYMKSTCRLDFSDFTQSGSYRIRVGETESPVFPINCRVYDGTADFLLNYLRQQQCGFNPFQNDSCHTRDAFVRYHPDKEGLYLDVRGGWHDAADLLQYTSTSANTIYQLMFAYQRHPEVFADSFKSNGLKGANGIPDIVDQIKWGLDWLNKMNPAKGELYNQIADDRDHIGMKMPKDDPADYGRGPGGGRPVYFVDGKPQQRGKFLNATMGAASTAGKFASDFALGSKVLQSFYPQFAAIIAAKATDAYQVGLDKPGNTQTVSVVSPYIYEEDNWVDDMELAAMELYAMTGDKTYFEQAIEYGRREPVTPWMGADSARHYQWYPFMNMGHYQLALAAGERVRDEFTRNIRAGIQRVSERAAHSPFLWGVPGIWCSNNLTTAMLTQCILYRELTADSTYVEMESALRDWLFGCNPWGTSMVVDLPLSGTYPHAPHSNWVFEKVGSPTGGLVDGPVYASIFNSLKGVNITDDMPHVVSNAYLNVQPGDVVYHDNTHDYSTNEPTLDGTASLVFPLASYEAQGRAQAAVQAASPIYDHGGIVKGNPADKRISLVFTAHEWADGAQSIISTLREFHIKGSFFFTGQFFNLYPDVVRDLLADGHYVSTHGYTHQVYAPWNNRDSCLVEKQEFVNDLKKAYATMATFGITPQSAPYFIPPYEWYNRHHASWARQMGLQIVNFTPGTHSNEDYTYPGIELESGAKYRSNAWLYDRMMNYEKEYGLNGHLLMIHFGTDPRRTEKLYQRLPEIITTLQQRGYTFVSVPELLK